MAGLADRLDPSTWRDEENDHAGHDQEAVALPVHGRAAPRARDRAGHARARARRRSHVHRRDGLRAGWIRRGGDRGPRTDRGAPREVAGDVDAVDRLLADEYVLTLSDGTPLPKAEYLRDVRSEETRSIDSVFQESTRPSSATGTATATSPTPASRSSPTASPTAPTATSARSPAARARWSPASA